MNELNDYFQNKDGTQRVLRGVAINSNSTWLAELAGRIGFETVWIDMEHGPADFEKVESLCMAAELGGAIPAVRISNGERTSILRALEIGARILIVPMVNDGAQARQIVKYGKFPPIGERGYNVRSRGLNFGLAGAKDEFVEANRRTVLIAQIETCEAVQNLDEICGTEGLSGVLFGPGDLSSNLGCTGEMNNPRLMSIITDCIRRVRNMGRHAGILVPAGPLLEAAMEAGCNFAYIGGDIADLTFAWSRLLKSVNSGIPKA